MVVDTIEQIISVSIEAIRIDISIHGDEHFFPILCAQYENNDCRERALTWAALLKIAARAPLN